MKKMAMVVTAMLMLPMMGIIVNPIVVATVNVGPPNWGGNLDETATLGFENNGGSSSDADLTYDVPWWVDMVDAEGLDETGEGVYIAVIDTGLVEDWDYYFDEDQIATEYGKGFSYDITWDEDLEDFVLGDLDTDRGYITKDIGSGHGTHVTSTITGYRAYLPADDFWIEGVAPGAKVIPILALDTWLLDLPDPEWENDFWPAYGPYGGKVRFSGGTDEMVEEAIRYVIDLAQDELADEKIVISMSLGFGEEVDSIEDAIDDAIDEGIIIVASAGNNGENGMGWPGAYGQVISCAAAGWSETYINGPAFWRRDVPEDLNTEDHWGNDWHIMLAPWSSRPNTDLGQTPSDLDVSDPGYYVLGPYQRRVQYYSLYGWIKYADWWGLDTYWFLSGTSMSAPHVSSIAAIVLEWAEDEDEEIDQDLMEKILKKGAKRNWPPASYDEASWYYGYYTWEWEKQDWGKGLLQADEALWAASTLMEDDD